MSNPLAPRTLEDLLELLRDALEHGYHTKASLYADQILKMKGY